jgi:hypothetical protein
MSKYFTDTLPLNKFSKELQSGTAAPTLFPFSFQQYFFPDYSIFKLSPTCTLPGITRVKTIRIVICYPCVVSGN